MERESFTAVDEGAVGRTCRAVDVGQVCSKEKNGKQHRNGPLLCRTPRHFRTGEKTRARKQERQRTACGGAAFYADTHA